VGIHCVTTTAYHLQSNGMIEQAHRQMNDAILSRLAGNKWLLYLAWVIFFFSGLKSNH
jgi:hypothetical protein